MRHSRWFLPPRWRSLEIVADVRRMREVPAHLPARGAVLVRADRLKWIVFDCPCDGGHRIVLPLDAESRPHWGVVTIVPLTISPSVDSVRSERRCHYFVQRGSIVWVRDNKNRNTRV
jgi:Family of unknown function (DUF6527)